MVLPRPSPTLLVLRCNRVDPDEAPFPDEVASHHHGWRSRCRCPIQSLNFARFKRGAVAFMSQVLRHVKANTTRADHSHGLAHGLACRAARRCSSRTLGWFTPSIAGVRGDHAGGQQDFVKAALDQVIHRHAGIELEP